MPRYFFNVMAGASSPDQEGFDLADVAEARFEASRLCGEMLRDDPAQLVEGQPWQMEVRDEEGDLAFTLSVSFT